MFLPFSNTKVELCHLILNTNKPYYSLLEFFSAHLKNYLSKQEQDSVIQAFNFPENLGKRFE